MMEPALQVTTQEVLKVLDETKSFLQERTLVLEVCGDCLYDINASNNEVIT